MKVERILRYITVNCLFKTRRGQFYMFLDFLTVYFVSFFISLNGIIRRTILSKLEWRLLQQSTAILTVHHAH